MPMFSTPVAGNRSPFAAAGVVPEQASHRPVQGDFGHADPERRRPCRCSDADGRRAYEGYSRIVYRGGTPSQTYLRIMERGGFSRSEMDEYAPGWTPVPLSDAR